MIFWGKHDKSNQDINAQSITRRFGMPYHKAVENKVQEWIESVHIKDKFTILDLACMELRMSPWAFAQTYAQNRFVFQFSPIVNSEIYKLMFTLPSDYKRKNQLSLDIIKNE